MKKYIFVSSQQYRFPIYILIGILTAYGCSFRHFSKNAKCNIGTYDTGTEEVTYSYREFTYTTNTKYAFLYMLFCYFWTSEFILAFGQLVVALSFTGWYFVRDKSTVGNGTVKWVSHFIIIIFKLK